MQQQHLAKPDLLSVVRKTVNPDAEYGRSIRCPFHNDREPSLHLYQTQTWYCFGCNKGGDVYDFYGSILFGNLWDNRNPRMFAEVRKALDREPCKKVFEPVSEKTPQPEITPENMAALRWAADAYHKALITGRGKDEENAREYLVRRGIAMETARKLKIGFAGRNELQKKGLVLEPKKRSAFMDRMEKAGLIRNGREYYCQRIIFPNIAKDGSVLNLTGRSLLPSGKRYLNIPNVKKELYLLGLSRPEETLFLTESVTDAVTLRQFGYQAAAVNGTALTRQMVASLEPYRSIVIVPQNDLPSANAASSWCVLIPRCRVMLPDYIDGEEKDVNDILRLEGERRCGAKLRIAANNIMDCADYRRSVLDKFEKKAE